MSAISSMHSIVISVESMSMATTRTRSRAEVRRDERAVDARAVAQSAATPACGPARVSRKACCAAVGERVDALRARRARRSPRRRPCRSRAPGATRSIASRHGGRAAPASAREQCRDQARGLTRRAHSVARSRASSMSLPVASATPMRRFLYASGLPNRRRSDSGTASACATSVVADAATLDAAVDDGRCARRRAGARRPAGPGSRGRAARTRSAPAWPSSPCRCRAGAGSLPRTTRASPLTNSSTPKMPRPPSSVGDPRARCRAPPRALPATSAAAATIRRSRR